MLYLSLMNIITAINQFENESCTVQIVRETFNFSNVLDEFYYNYEPSKRSHLTDFAIKVLEEQSIPLVLVDLLDTTQDFFFRIGYQYRHSFKSNNFQSFYTW